MDAIGGAVGDAIGVRKATANSAESVVGLTLCPLVRAGNVGMATLVLERSPCLASSRVHGRQCSRGISRGMGGARGNRGPNGKKNAPVETDDTVVDTATVTATAADTTADAIQSSLLTIAELARDTRSADMMKVVATAMHTCPDRDARGGEL
jgi:hypothetical protein